MDKNLSARSFIVLILIGVINLNAMPVIENSFNLYRRRSAKINKDFVMKHFLMSIKKIS